ncbi:beta-lactamase domain-containing protein [Pseudodesulfovibrio mercurii]|uniref:Beta-lactamase domain-containing protein n=1 Tax=Pseudodesulfovibrio mercurii TaxID=641491 RepID=F0JGI5_9BACT|nr:ribonuclease Z [Pseudodesulfovibrio mercurii]EGB15102.1 beta-lactamase domain-containing protein [Pseudodesulfovibrio mercurii]
MRVTFVGVGEAFDERLPNTSLLVEHNDSSILLDCGFNVSCGLWRYAARPLDLDAVYVSHFHADHYFGLPALIVRSLEEGRTKRLTILGPSGIESRVNRLMELAYSNALAKAGFEIFFIECVPGEDFKHGGFRFRFALNDHSMPCLAVRLDAGGKSLYYSGDGKPTDATVDLAEHCDLVVHEAFTLDEITTGHGDVGTSLDMARRSGAGACALVHMKRTIRHTMMDVIRMAVETETSVHGFVPEPGDVHEL